MDDLKDVNLGEDIEKEKQVSKEIKELMRSRDFGKAIELAEKYPQNGVIQSQRITILIGKGKLKEAKRIGKEFPFKAEIQSQMITIAIREGRLEEAKKIGEKFPEASSIQSQMITIALKERNIERALEIAEKFPDSETIKFQVLKINEKKFLDEIRTKIYYDKIEDDDIEKIKNSNVISEYQRICMLLAIHEKQGDTDLAKQMVKKYKNENPESEHIGTFNNILSRIQSKRKRIFDYQYYDGLLKWEIDEKLKQKYEQEENKKNVGRRLVVEKVEVAPIEQEKFEERTHYQRVTEFLKSKIDEAVIRINSYDEETRKIGTVQAKKIKELLEKVEVAKDNKEYLDSLYKKVVRIEAKEKNITD